MKPDPNKSYTRPLCNKNVAIECKYGSLEVCSACDSCGWNPEVEERRIKDLYGVMYGEDPIPDEQDEDYYR